MNGAAGRKRDMELCDCSHEWGERGIWSCAYCWTVAMNGEKEGYGAVHTAGL